MVFFLFKAAKLDPYYSTSFLYLGHYHYQVLKDVRYSNKQRGGDEVGGKGTEGGMGGGTGVRKGKSGKQERYQK